MSEVTKQKKKTVISLILEAIKDHDGYTYLRSDDIANILLTNYGIGKTVTHKAIWNMTKRNLIQIMGDKLGKNNYYAITKQDNKSEFVKGYELGRTLNEPIGVATRYLQVVSDTPSITSTITTSGEYINPLNPNISKHPTDISLDATSKLPDSFTMPFDIGKYDFRDYNEQTHVPLAIRSSDTTTPGRNNVTIQKKVILNGQFQEDLTYIITEIQLKISKLKQATKQDIEFIRLLETQVDFYLAGMSMEIPEAWKVHFKNRDARRTIELDSKGLITKILLKD